MSLVSTHVRIPRFHPFKPIPSSPPGLHTCANTCRLPGLPSRRARFLSVAGRAVRPSAARELRFPSLLPLVAHPATPTNGAIRPLSLATGSPQELSAERCDTQQVWPSARFPSLLCCANFAIARDPRCHFWCATSRALHAPEKYSSTPRLAYRPASPLFPGSICRAHVTPCHLW